MQVCYALATNGDPHYSDLVTISVGAVRRLYPAAKITILTDDQSWPHVAVLGRHLHAVTQSAGTYPGDARARSRFVKTQVRSIMSGDFIFLDADTLPVATFDELLLCQAPVGAAANWSPEASAGEFPVEQIPYFEQLNWTPPASPYLNSGVIFWRDCAAAYDLGQLWHRNWRKFFETVDNPLDQAAFNHSSASLGITPTIVDGKFNFWPGRGHGYGNDTRIYHFYAHGEDTPEGTILDALLDRYRDSGRVEYAIIDEAARRGHVLHTETREWMGQTLRIAPDATPTSIDQLPILAAVAGRYPANWDDIEGLRVEPLHSPPPAGQIPLSLTPTTTVGRHRLGVRIVGLETNYKHRISAWLRCTSAANFYLELRDDTNAHYGKAAFSLGRDAGYGKDPDIIALGAERKEDGWTRIWAEMKFSGDVAVAYVWLANRLGRTEFRGDGRASAAFGGFQVEPRPAAQSRTVG